MAIWLLYDSLMLASLGLLFFAPSHLTDSQCRRRRRCLFFSSTHQKEQDNGEGNKKRRPEEEWERSDEEASIKRREERINNIIWILSRSFSPSFLVFTALYNDDDDTIVVYASHKLIFRSRPDRFSWASEKIILASLGVSQNFHFSLENYFADRRIVRESFSRDELNFSFSTPFHWNCALNAPIFTNDLQWDDDGRKTFHGGKHIFIPYIQRTTDTGKKVFFPSMMLLCWVLWCWDKDVLVRTIRGAVFAFFVFHLNEEQWMETQKKVRKSIRRISQNDWERSDELHHILSDEHDTYPEHQVHENHEKFDDRTANIHCEFIFFSFAACSKLRFLFTEDFFLWLSARFLLSFTDLPLNFLFIFRKTFFSSTLWHSVRVANRAIQMFTSDWRETIANKTRREGKHSESAAQARCSSGAFREPQQRNIWRRLRALRPFEKR
jgi:hypothetical protein